MDSVDEQTTNSTVFGAPASSTHRVVAELRAVASRHGVVLADVGVFDACCAAAAAQMLTAAAGTESFADVRLQGNGISEALARIMMRAAGQPVPHRPPTPPTHVSESLVIAAEGAVEHLAELDDPHRAAVAAAEDLGDDVEVLAAAATALLAAAVPLSGNL